MTTTLILGAHSTIAQAIAHRFARAGHHLILTARNSDRLASLKKDLGIRYGVNIELRTIDISVTEQIENLAEDPNLPDVVISAVGMLPDQSTLETDKHLLVKNTQTNFINPAVALEFFANSMVARRHGTVVGITSVAGDRGRASNYGYGAAKSALSTYLSGLRQRLHGTGVTVIDVRPGFVETPMTTHLKFPALLIAKPETIANDVYQAVIKSRSVIYSPFYWRWIMLAIRLTPEFIFSRIKF